MDIKSAKRYYTEYYILITVSSWNCNFVIKHPYDYHTVSIIFWIIAMSVSIGIFVVDLRKIHGMSEIEKPEPPVVF